MSTLLFLGQLQGLLLSLALLSSVRGSSPERRVASLWLAALMLSVSVALILPQLVLLDLADQWSRSLILISGLPLLFGPLLLGHVAAQTGHQSWLRPRWVALHGLIPVLYYLAALPLVFRSDAELAQLIVFEPEQRLRFSWLPIIKHLSFVGYALAALWLLHRYQLRLRERLAEVELFSLHWLRALVWSALVLALGLSVSWIAGWSDRSHDAGLSVALCVLMISAGFHALRRSPVFDGEAVSAPTGGHAAYRPPGGSEPPRPLLPPSDLAILEQRLDSLADDESLLHDHNLTLDRLAVAFKVSPHQLSWALNQVRGQRFYDYINGLRVESVKKRLSDQRISSTPILDIALSCGFANKTTFNKAFKDLTGLTPSAFRQQAAASQ